MTDKDKKEHNVDNIIDNRFKKIRKIEGVSPNIYEGHDINLQCDILLIEIDCIPHKDKKKPHRICQISPGI